MAATAGALGLWAVAVVGTAGGATPTCGTNGSFLVSSSAASCTYAQAGTDNFSVPAGVSSATFTVDGAQGESATGIGGTGGRVSATLTVSPGDLFTVNVGALGTNGGGPGGVSAFESVEDGARGGGYSSVTNASTTPATLELLAGGGGGSGGSSNAFEATQPGGDGGFGGIAGFQDGQQGGNDLEPTFTVGGGGGGTGAASGGDGGVAGTVSGAPDSSCVSLDGAQGTSGSQDGAGADASDLDEDVSGGGGGGGGGLVGGGGGGSGSSLVCDSGAVQFAGGGGGGGGGLSYADPSLSATFDDGANNSSGRVTVSWSVKPTSTSVSAPAEGTPNTAITASHITSTLSAGGASPTGTITFTVFGPQSSAPTDCGTGGAPVGAVTVSGDGSYSPSAGFTPTAAGSYWWYASYSGDTDNAPSDSGCGAGMASTAVTNPTATTVSAPAGETAGTEIAAGSLGATLSGAGNGATGTITFTVFGPQSSAPTDCGTGGAPVGAVTVSGDGSYSPSAGFTPTAAGSYWWYASYSGDTDNAPSDSGCGAGMASTTVANQAPVARITAPADGQVYAVGQAVPTTFSCAEGPDSPGLSACTDSADASAPAGVLDTAQPGTFTYTVTATSKDGLDATASIHYTVAAAPSAPITTPADGARYTKGQVIDADYRCQDGADGPGIAACAGTIADGQPIDTATPGTHTFTVTATSRDRESSTTTTTYSVLPTNRLKVAHIRTHRDGAITFTVTPPGPGTIGVLETAWNDNLVHTATLLYPATSRFAYARRQIHTTNARAIHIRVRPNRRGKRLVHDHTYQVVLRLWVTYTRTGGTPHSVGFYGLHLPK